jgi:hypothetical protein
VAAAHATRAAAWTAKADALHVALLEAPTSKEKVPGPQRAHVDAPCAGAKDPQPQSAQATAPAPGWKDPAAQARQADAARAAE